MDHLEYSHRKEILNIILEQVGSDIIYESSDGSRVDTSKLPVNTIIQIKNFIMAKLKTIDITDKFDTITDNTSKKTQKTPKTQKTKKNKKAQKAKKIPKEDKNKT